MPTIPFLNRFLTTNTDFLDPSPFLYRLKPHNVCRLLSVAGVCIVLVGLFSGKVSGQTTIFSNPGTSYTASDNVTNNTYNIPVTNCTSISFSLEYDFSLPWEGSGNMESSDECVPCAGDPASGPSAGPCGNCWDFIYVRYQVGGVTVFSELIGDAGTTDSEQSGTISFGPICTNGATNAAIIVQTQTWAGDETITFTNLTVQCWDSRATLMATPNPYCESQVLNLNANLSNPSSVSSHLWSGPGTIDDPSALGTTVTGLPLGTNTFTFTATDQNSCTRSSTINVNVGASPTLNPPADVTVCAGSPTFNIPLSGTAGATYNWTNDNPLIGLAASGTSTTNIPITPANVSSPQVATITITPRIGACLGPPQTVMVTVNPRPTVINPGPKSFCSGANIDIPLSGSSGTATYNWTNSNINIGIPGSGSDVVSGTAANVPNTISGTITITPTENGCNGPTQSFPISVSPSPSVNPIASIVRCAGQAVNVVFTGSSGGVIYEWTNDNPAVGLAQTSGTGNTIGFTTAMVGSQEVATITVTPRIGICMGVPETFTITVVPAPVVVDPPNQSLCAGQQMVVNFAGASTGSTYTWTNSNTNIGLPATGTGNINAPSPAVTAPVTTTITVRATDNGCQGNTQTFTVTVSPSPTVNALPDLSYCGSQMAGVSIGGSAGATFNWTNNNTNIGLPATGSGSIAFTTANVTATTVATITVTPFAGTCNGPQRTFTITVNPIPTLPDPPDQSLCVGDPITVNFNAVPANTVLSWTNSNTAIGLAANGTGNISGTALGVAAVQTGTITVTPTIGTCTGSPQNFTLTVSPTPTVNPVSPVSACAGLNVNIALSGTTNATFNWLNNNPAIGLPATGSGNINFTANAAAVAQTATINVIGTLNGCSGPLQTINVTVTPTPTLTDPPNLNLCSGAPIVVTFNATPANATFNWTNSNTAIGLPAVASGDISTSSAPVSSPQTGTITVVPSIGTCNGSPQDFTVTVTPVPDVAPLPPVARCAGDMVDLPLTSTPAATLNWANDNTATGLPASGSGNLVFTAAAVTTPQISNIIVTPVIGTCSGVPRSFALTVNPIPRLDNPGTLNVCGGAPINVNFTGTATTFSWTNNNTNIGVPANGTGNINVPSANTSGTASITATPGGICAGPPQVFAINVTETPTVATLPDLVRCGGQTAAVVFAGTGSPIFNWTNSNPNIGLAASGTGNIPDFTTTTPNGTAETATITVTPVNGTCPGAARTFTITVNPGFNVNDPVDISLCGGGNITVPFTGNAPTYTWTNSNTAIGLPGSGSGNITGTAADATGTATITVTPGGACPGPAQTFTIAVTGLPSLNAVANLSSCSGQTLAIPFTGSTSATYNWTNSNPNIGLAANGTGNIPNFTTTAPNGTSETATLAVTPSIGTCIGTPSSFTVTVNPSTAVNDPADVAVCAGDPVNVNFTGNAGNYTWTNSNTDIGLAASGSGNLSFLAGATAGSATITVAPGTGGACAGPAQTFTINIASVVTVAPVPTTSICANQPVQINFSGTSGTNYTWTNSNTNVGLPANGTGNLDFLAANVLTPQLATITVTPRAGSCIGTAITFDLTINPVPNVALVTPQTVCSGLPVNVVFSGTGNPVFNWTSSNPQIGLPTTGSGNISLVTPNTAVPISTTVVVTPQANGCAGTPDTFALNVNPVPVLTPPVNVSTCAGQLVTVNFTGSGSAPTYNWTNNNTDIGLPASGSGNISFTAPLVVAAQNATFSVTPTDATGCMGPSQTFDLSISPLPAVDVVSDVNACAGNPVSVSFIGTVGAGYSWTNSNPAIGLPSSGSGNRLNFTGTTAGNSPDTAVITVTPTLGNCIGAVRSFQIVVNPSPSVDSLPDLSVCSGQMANINFTGNGGALFFWVNDNTATGLAAGGNGNIGFTSAMVGTNQNSIVTVVPSSGICQGAARSFRVTVLALPVATVLSDRSICGGDSLKIQFSGSLGASFQWNNNNPNIGLPPSGTGDLNLPISSVNAIQTAQLTVTPSLNTCIGTPVAFNLTVNPRPTAAIDGNLSICSGQSTTLTASGGGTYLWNTSQTTSAISVTPFSDNAYNVIVSSNANCTASATVTVKVRETSGTTRLATTCDPAEAGVKTAIFPNQFGCDSTVTTITTLLRRDTTRLTRTTCNPAQAGTTTALLTNMLGCDSLLITTVNFDPAGRDTTLLTRSSCDPAQTGTTQTMLIGADGCDSLLLITTTLLLSDTTRLTRKSCNPTQLGTITERFNNQAGCDSLVLTTTVFDPVGIDTTVLRFISCNPAQAGTTQTLLKGVDGCDSLLLRITSFDPAGRDTTTLRSITCNPAQAGTNQTLLMGQDGCDSLVIRIITFDPAGRDTTQLARVSCDPSQVGTAQTLLVGRDGCDSLLIITTALSPKDTTQQSLGTCDAALVGTTNARLLQNRFGCDSLILTTFVLDAALCVFQPTVASVAPNCATSNDALVNIRINSGAPPYQFSWSSGSGGVGSGQITAVNTPVAINNLPPGPFSVTITKTGTTLDTVFKLTITAPPLLTATASATLPAPPFAFRCATDSNGQASASANGGIGPYFYKWNTGSDQAALSQLLPGTYTVTVTDQNRCTAVSTVALSVPPPLDFEATIAKPACGETLAKVFFTATGGVKPYTASINGNTLNGLSATLSNGRYLVTLSDKNGCALDSTLNIALLPPFTVVLPPDTTLRLGEELLLNAITDLPIALIDTVIWNPLPPNGNAGQLSQQWFPNKTQRYAVTVTDTFGCKESAQILVAVSRDVAIYVPNVFTPDSKLGNDFFTLSAGPGVENLEVMRIYDRWGNQTYHWDTPIPVNEWPGWDGRMGGKDVGQGVYVYYLKVRLADGSLFEKKGDVTVLRR